MGFFTIGTAIILVVLQTTLLFLNRDATSWTFSLIKKTDRLPDGALLSSLFLQHAGAREDEGPILQALGSDSGSGLSQCILKEWALNHPFPPYCLLW